MFIGKMNNIVLTIKQIFGISSSILYVWRDSYKLNGKIVTKKIGRPPKSGKITDAIEKYVINYYVKQKKYNIKNLRRSIKRIFNVSVKRSSIYGILKKNKITLKKTSVDRSPYSDTTKKEKYNKLKEELNYESKNTDNVISYDESYMSPELLKRKYGWSKKGTKAIQKVNGKTYRQGKSMMMAISNKKTIAFKLHKGPVKGNHICDFIMSEVIKNDTGKTLLMDNAQSHKNKKLKEEMKRTGNKIVFNVPYSPQTNPIEYMNNVVKNDLKKQNIENVNNLENKLAKIINIIPEKIYQNCFRKAYACMTVA